MTISANYNGNFRIKYGPWIDALPEPGTLAEIFPFKQQAKIGEKYRVPFTAAIEHGQTASRAGGLFALNPAISGKTPYAELDGSTIVMRAQVSWDDIYASLNGNSMSGGGNAASYQDMMSLKVKHLGQGGQLYRELALGYGPGATSTAASNIGVVSTTAAAVNTSPSVRISRASFIPGLWPLMMNALVDVYQSDGTTLRAGNVQVLGVPSQTKTQVKFGVSTVTGKATVNPTAVITANDIIVPAGWVGQSCIGVEPMFATQTGTIFTVDITTISQFRALEQDNSNGPLTRALIRAYLATLSYNGSKRGGRLAVCGGAFSALAEEQSGQVRDTTKGGDKLQGETSLTFQTPGGEVEVFVWDLCKQGQAIYFANTADCYRVGTTDLTMRPVEGISENFLTNLTDYNGCQIQNYANQAPFVSQPWHCMRIKNIQSTGDILDLP